MGTSRLSVANLLSQHELALRRGWRSGIDAWGDLAFTYDEYARGVLERVQMRLSRLGVAPAQNAVARVLESSRLGDLYLALCCESGLDAGWSALSRELMPRLKALARSRGDAETEAEDLVSEFPGYLALPPPEGGANTRLGTFEGASTIFGWLAVLLNRRRIDRNRARNRFATRDTNPDETWVAAAKGPEPAAVAVGVERSAKLREAITSAFGRMSSRETLAMRLKYADGLQQREIAKLFAVGEARVSVLLKNATEKMRAALLPALGDEWRAHGSGDVSVWTSLRDALGTQLASSTKPPDIPGRSHD